MDAAWLNLIEAKHPALYRVLLAAMTDSNKAHLAYMAARLLELRRVLKPTGSIYLHCDPTMSHYLKLVMDAVFGRRNFRNEVVWCYRKWTVAANQFARSHDVILMYVSRPDTWWTGVRRHGGHLYAGSRRSRVPRSSVRKRIAQEPSVAVGLKATAWPRKALGNRRWRPWKDTQPPAWTLRT